MNKSIALFKSKYPIPMLNEDINIIERIKLLISIDILLSPLVYQQRYASKGEIKVNPYHIIIYFLGLKPLKNIVYK